MYSHTIYLKPLKRVMKFGLVEILHSQNLALQANSNISLIDVSIEKVHMVVYTPYSRDCFIKSAMFLRGVS